jgi:hypothetical protein
MDVDVKLGAGGRKQARTHNGKVLSMPPAVPMKFLRVKLVRQPLLKRAMQMPLNTVVRRLFSGTESLSSSTSPARKDGSARCALASASRSFSTSCGWGWNNHGLMSLSNGMVESLADLGAGGTGWCPLCVLCVSFVCHLQQEAHPLGQCLAFDELPGRRPGGRRGVSCQTQSVSRLAVSYASGRSLKHRVCLMMEAAQAQEGADRPRIQSRCSEIDRSCIRRR